MGSQLIPFDAQGNLPAYLSNPGNQPDINKDVVRAAQYPTMSIKGKVFTLNQDGVKKILTKPDDPEETAQSIGVVILRANMGGKTWYAKGYVEGDASPPDCHSYDGVSPSAHAKAPQAKKCQLCPRHVWKKMTGEDGAVREGRECGDHARLAIAAPDKLDKAMLLRVPAASLKHLREAVKIINQRKIPYNAVVMKISFDPEASSPLLKFKPVGLLNDADFAKAGEVYDGELVRAIVGLDETAFEAAPEPEGPVSADELDAAIAAREAANKASAAAKETPAPAPAPAAAKPVRKPAAKPQVDADDIAAATAAPAPAPAPAAPKPTASSGASDLLADLDGLLGTTDD